MIYELLSFPGDIDSYIDTIIMLTRYVAQTQPDQNTMITYIKNRFHDIHTDNSILNLIWMLRKFSLIKCDGETIVVTNEGNALLSGDPKEIMYNQLRTRIVGVENIENILSNGPRNLQDIHNQIKRDLDLNWETDMQTKYRLKWLEAVGAVKYDNGLYHKTRL